MGQYGVLGPISRNYPPLRDRLLTCYSAVRHYPDKPKRTGTVRLACIRRTASVRPEPGSNSTDLTVSFHYPVVKVHATGCVHATESRLSECTLPSNNRRSAIIDPQARGSQAPETAEGVIEGCPCSLAALGQKARLAGDVELDAMADDIAGDVVAYRSQESLDRCRAELADVAALDTDGVMVVLDP